MSSEIPPRPRGFAFLRSALGLPALVLATVSLVMFVSGLIIVQREFDRLDRTGQDVARRTFARWTRTASADYLGVRNLVDDADAWRRADLAVEPGTRQHVADSLDRLGRWFETQNTRAPLLEVSRLVLRRSDDSSPLEWSTRGIEGAASRSVRVPVLEAGEQVPAVWLDVRYQVEPDLAAAASALETSYRRMLLAIVGLSGYSLLCLIYTGLHAQAARRQSAQEAARQATIDLADRTCHELGNLAYVLGNERRNLDDHLDLVDQSLAALGPAFDAAIERARIGPELAERLRASWLRELARRGLDGELESSQALARTVCDQMSLCAKYVTLTVRELDSYLKESQIPPRIEALDLRPCVDEALMLLAPALSASNTTVTRDVATDPTAVRAMADRRLLVHAIVNVVKNAIEAVAQSGRAPIVAIRTLDDGNHVTLEISDNGPGFPTDGLARIFDPGFSTKGAGRGRGLAIVRTSIEKQGGTITAANVPGSGAHVSIALPREGGRRALRSGSFLSAQAKMPN